MDAFLARTEDWTDVDEDMVISGTLLTEFIILNGSIVGWMDRWTVGWIDR